MVVVVDGVGESGVVSELSDWSVGCLVRLGRLRSMLTIPHLLFRMFAMVIFRSLFLMIRSQSSKDTCELFVSPQCRPILGPSVTAADVNVITNGGLNKLIS